MVTMSICFILIGYYEKAPITNYPSPHPQHHFAFSPLFVGVASQMARGLFEFVAQELLAEIDLVFHKVS
jgi:hypothetical protein